jgi:putative oxidoreductase
MSTVAARWTALTPEFRSLLRIVAAFMFLQAGAMKLFGWPAASPSGVPPVLSQIWIGAWMELLGGTLLLVGLFTRPVAFLLSGEMAVAYFQFHFPNAFWPAVNQGVPAVLYCFIWLYLSAAGPGPWSLDAALRKK